MDDREDRALEIAALRYRIIAEAAEADGTGVTAEIKDAASRDYLGLEGQVFVVSERTLWRWLKQYSAGGLRALMPKQRSDARQVHPERFVNGPPRLVAAPHEVWINPPRQPVDSTEGELH
ncbi:MAG: hypothetical protein ABI333_15510 [bacterium]